MTKFDAILGIGDTISVMIAGTPYLVNNDHAAYSDLKKAVQEDNADAFLEKYSLKDVFCGYVGQRVETRGNKVFLDGSEIPEGFTNLVFEMIKESINPVYVENFIVNLMDNPSRLTISHLYDFLQHKGMPLTEDGCFLGYKAVTKNLKDKRTGTFDNSIGAVVREQRNTVCDDREIGCSNGLHVGSLEYASSFASCDDRLVIVKVNPKDVVSIPLDCGCQKLRCCEYKVLYEYNKQLPDLVSDVDKDMTGRFVKKENDSLCYVREHVNDQLVVVNVKTREIETVHVEDVRLLTEDADRVDLGDVYEEEIVRIKGVPYWTLEDNDWDDEVVCLNLQKVETETLDYDEEVEWITLD